MLEWLFRPLCPACGVLVETPLCDACSLSLVEAGPAEPRPPLASIAAPWRYGGQLATAILRLKFYGLTYVARALAPLWSPLLAAAVAEHDAVVVPVPLHWRRRFRRGYDQSWLLAQHACAHAGLARPQSVLRRVLAAPAQSTLTAAERAANLHGAFEVRDPRPIAGRAVIVVDDVITTGATLAAVARPLLAAGASRVVGIAVARA